MLTALPAHPILGFRNKNTRCFYRLLQSFQKLHIT